MATPGEARIAPTLGVGGAVGTLKNETETNKLQGYSFRLDLSWQPEFGGKLRPLALGFTGEQLKLSYTEDSIKKASTYNLIGPHLGLFLMTGERFSLELRGAYYPSAALTTLADNAVRLNGSAFGYSTWQMLSGEAATEGRLNFHYDKADGQFNKKNRLRTGVGVSCITETLTKAKTEISTSKEAITPAETTTVTTIKTKLTVISVDFYLGLTF